MVQAAANAGLDFATANPRSRHWWLKLRWILDRTEDLSSTQIYKMQHAQHVGILDHRMAKEAFEHHWNGANKLIRDSYRIYYPWLQDSKETTQGQPEKTQRDKEVDALMDSWKKQFGDPSDPKVHARFKSIAEAMRKRALEGQKDNFSSSRSLSSQLKQVADIRKKQAKKRVR